jgi:TRAP-type C4-dicarboxylate transport system substrate-binding protein
MKKLAFIVLVVVLATSLFSGSCGDGKVEDVEAITLTMASFLPDIPPGGNWANLFIDKVEEISDGKMTIQFMGPEAIPAPDAPAAVQRGTIDIASALAPFCDALVPGSNTIGRAEYNPMELRKGEAFEYYQTEFEKVGIYYLGASVSSEAQVQTVIYLGKEIDSLDDLAGLKIAATGGSNKSFIEALGGVCVPIDFTDYFTAMERGTVDGYNIGIPGIQDFSLTPVTKAMLDEPVSSCGGMMIMNLDKWNSLSDAQREVLTKAMIEAEIEGAKMFTESVEQVKEDIAAEGVKIIHLSKEDSIELYLAYRNAMWAEDEARWPEIAPKLKEWLVDPDFHRTK